MGLINVHTHFKNRECAIVYTTPLLVHSYIQIVQITTILCKEWGCEVSGLLTMLLANTSTVQKLHLAFSWLHHDLFCSEIDMNVSKEGSRDMKTYGERKCCWQVYKDCRWKKSVDTSPTDNGDIF